MIQTWWRRSWAYALSAGVIAAALIITGPTCPASAAKAGQDAKFAESAPVDAARMKVNAQKMEQGFLGWIWGSRPGESEGAIFLAGIASGLSVYSDEQDISSVTGEILPSVAPRLVFSAEKGLVLVHIDFAYEDYPLLEKRLKQLLGEPPVVYDIRIAKPDFGEEIRWQTGENTQVVLVSNFAETYLEIGFKDYFFQEDQSFNQLLDTALLKRAEAYDRENLAPEASSIYQILLNGKVSYSSFTLTAQERLAAYSQRPEAVTYLCQNGDLRFSRLKNLFIGSMEQQWLIIELGPTARTELQGLRPAEIGPEDELTKISSVLCRVRIDGKEGKYVLAEQIWLDSENHIIGGRPACFPQDKGWPAPFFSEACERFLTAWLSFSTEGQLHGNYFHQAQAYENMKYWGKALYYYNLHIKYAKEDDPDLPAAKRRYTEITRMLPDLGAGGK